MVWIDKPARSETQGWLKNIEAKRTSRVPIGYFEVALRQRLDLPLYAIWVRYRSLRNW